VSEALYGREYIGLVGGRDSMGRLADGLFCRGQCFRLGGVVVARRVDYRLFVPYNLVLLTSPAPLPVEEVVRALGIRDVLGPDDYP
jgi:hypothetical protein